MKKGTTGWIFKHALIMIGLFSVIAMVSCKDDDPIEDPIASFQYEISEDNFLQVAFTNFSVNADTYAWNFGDGSTSAEVNPTHTYAEVGEYTVHLTATNSVGVTANFSETIEVKDPFEALTLLAGQTSKTWRLYRTGTSMGVGENVDNPRGWWALENTGARPCVYYHEFTFNRQGQFIFDDKGSFWGEEAVFAEPQKANCFEATPANMVNSEGADVSAWLSGTHAFEYNPATNMVTLTGLGAWMGLPQLATNDVPITPVVSKSFKITIEEHDGYDLMKVLYVYEWGVWEFSYASYSNPALEPPVVEEEEVDPELETITPTALGHTFESETSFDLLGTIGGASVITPGVDDPVDANATKVGKFDRTDARYQEAQLRVSPEPKNIIFSEFTKVSIDVYLPSSNTYDPLTKKVIIGFGDIHGDGGNWWQRLIQYESDELALDEWVTVTLDLNSPSYSGEVDGQTVFDRDNLDMIFLQIGGGDHTSAGVFYIRNLTFE